VLHTIYIRLKRFFRKVRAKQIFLIFIAVLLLGWAVYHVLQFDKNINQPVAVVVPHHDVVKDKRHALLQLVAQNRPVTTRIFLLSPDHFSPRQYAINFSNQDWSIKNQTLQFDKALEPQLSQALDQGSGLVATDHGITNILSDIADFWPNAKIVPMIIGQKLTAARMDKLVSLIDRNCNSDCLIIASVDFSHYLPYQLADIHDENSKYALQTLDFDELSKLEVDSPQSLYTVAKVANLKGANNWNLYAHTNSTKIGNLPDTESTSHIFGFYNYGRKVEGIKPETFTLATNLKQSENKDSLGERFFYGPTYVNTALTSGYILDQQFIVNPISGKSYISNKEGVNVFNLGDDISLSGIHTARNTHILVQPLRRTGNKAYLLRGQEKKAALKNILTQIAPNQNIKVDIENGTIDITLK
jgi:MEMO1 family protein